MIETMSKPKRILFLLAIFLTNIAACGELIITPITYNIYEAFPGQTMACNFIISAPMLIMIVVSLIVPKIINILGKKNTLLLGTILFTASGILTVAINSIPFIICMRIINAIGQAIVNVDAMTLIADAYPDDQKRGTITGYYSAFMGLLSAVLSAISGSLAAISWTNAFFTYWAGVPMIILVFLCIPYMNDTKEEVQNTETKSHESYGRKFIIYCITLALFFICYCIPVYFGSVYIQENALGNEAFSGLVSSVCSIAGMLAGLGFGFIYSKSKKYTGFISYLLLAIVLLLLYIKASAALLMICMFVAGFVMNLVYSFGFSYALTLVPESKTSGAIAILQAVSGCGQFAATYVVTFLMGILNTDLVKPILIIPAVVAIIIALVEFVCRKSERTN